MKISKRQILGGLSVAVASLAFAAPAAQADDWYVGHTSAVVRPDDRADRTTVLHRSGHVVSSTVVRPDDRAVRVSPVTTEALVRPDDRAVRVSPVIAETPVRPDDRAVRVSPGTVDVPVRPDDRGVRTSPVTPVEPVTLPDDRSGVRGPGSAPQPTPAHIVVSPTGFDWTDAGIGAGMALGLILLGSGMLLVARRHRRPTAVA